MSLEIFFIILVKEFLFSILILQSYIVPLIRKLSSDDFWKSDIVCEIRKDGITSKYFIMGLLEQWISVLSTDWLLKCPEYVSFVLLAIPYDPKRHKFLFKSHCLSRIKDLLSSSLNSQITNLDYLSLPYIVLGIISNLYNYSGIRRVRYTASDTLMI
jgi:hypothetical protein